MRPTDVSGKVAMVSSGSDVPNSQKERKTDVRPLTTAFKRARYRAHDDAGEPGSGSRRPEDDGDRDMAAG